MTKKMMTTITGSYTLTKEIRCSGCNTLVMKIETGSIKKGTVGLCEGCEIKRKMSDLSKTMKTSPNTMENPFSDIFGDIFGGRK